MSTAFTASIAELLPGLELGSTAPGAGNAIALEGLVTTRASDGSLEVRARKLEAASLRIASPPFVLEVGGLALHDLVAPLRMDAGRPRLEGVRAASAELSGVQVHGPLVLAASGTAAAPPAAPGAWSLGPLATAEGAIRAEIVDAHLVFDADVTVPIRQGLVDFSNATVEHVGPDSRMGASRLGIYVDAPNGRSYLYQFASVPVAGVAFEKRGTVIGPWVTDRGSLKLQEFGEGLLRQGTRGHARGLTDQSRLLFDRTAVSGEVRLGDGTFAAPGLRAEFVGRAAGSNAVRLQSGAVGRGGTVDIASLAVQEVALALGGAGLQCDDVTGSLQARLSLDGGQLRFALTLGNVKLAGVRLQLAGAAPPRPAGDSA